MPDSTILINPSDETVLRTIESDRFVTGVTWVDGELWHGTWEGDESALRRLDPQTGEILEVLTMPRGAGVSGLESDGGDQFFCGGGAAFAVASFGPDASELPVRQVLDAVKPLPIAEQADALQAHTFDLYRSETVRPTDTVDSLLARLGVSDPLAAAFLRQDTAIRTQLLGRYGRSVRAEVTDQHALKTLTARWVADDSGYFRRLVVERKGASFSSRYETAPLVPSSLVVARQEPMPTQRSAALVKRWPSSG